jgi:hypothetical protein
LALRRPVRSPDDETLAAGALTDAAALDGIDVRTITLTLGERGLRRASHSPEKKIRRWSWSPSLRRFGLALGSIIRRFGRDAVCAGLDREYRPQLGEVHRPQHIVYVLAPARAFRMIGGSVLRAAAHVQP